MPTRFYFPATGVPPIIQTPSAFWNDATEGETIRMKTTKGNSTIAIGNIIDLATTQNSKDLDRQFISDPLWGNQVIQGTVSGQLMVREYATTDNVNAIIASIRVISNKGGTVRGTCLNSGIWGGIDSNGEFVNNASHRNKIIFSGNSMSPITGLDGDRICLEIGYNVAAGGGTSPQASAKWGENAPDLPSNNEAQTSDGAGWFQMNSVNLKFKKNINCEINDEGCI